MFTQFPFVNQQSLGLKMSRAVQYGQILIVEKKEIPADGIPDVGLDLKIELITDSLDKIQERLTGVEGVEIPSRGAQFPPKMKASLDEAQKESSVDLLQISQKYYQCRQLLVARLLSQLVAKTWLKEDQLSEQEKKTVPVIQKLILLGNSAPISSISEDAKDSPDIIRPGMQNWQSVILNLLLCGQAFLKENDILIPLYEPILSSFEAVNLYAFKLVLDRYVSEAEELFSPGAAAEPPYYMWTFPYPPNTAGPDSPSTPLTHEMVDAWARAQIEGGPLPLYKSDNVNDIEYVYPPYPFMAGSH